MNIRRNIVLTALVLFLSHVLRGQSSTDTIAEELCDEILLCLDEQSGSADLATLKVCFDRADSIINHHAENVHIHLKTKFEALCKGTISEWIDDYLEEPPRPKEVLSDSMLNTLNLVGELMPGLHMLSCHLDPAGAPDDINITGLTQVYHKIKPEDKAAIIDSLLRIEDVVNQNNAYRPKVDFIHTCRGEIGDPARDEEWEEMERTLGIGLRSIVIINRSAMSKVTIVYERKIDEVIVDRIIEYLIMRH